MKAAKLGFAVLLLAAGIWTPARAAANSVVCGACSDADCAGQTVNSRCGTGSPKVCQQISTCGATAVPECECISPP